MRLKSFVRRHWFLLLVATGLLVFVGMHLVWYIHPSDIKSMSDLEAHLYDGQPTVIEFYSNL
jgi:hypothetical protein